ncbi:MAG: HTH-type transcriptional activator IlvY [Plesiomonas sp.]|uniref:HTH-type transcriptional activator IlvY n=1 Tax=Plesiomonas sp. TaxID=2486279 RepID=UPI003F306C9E
MDLRDLKLFLHLANSCHFGRSAQACHVSPSTLSRQIQRLEEELGQPLFVRDNRSVTLTDAGLKMRSFAEQTLQQWQQLHTSVHPQADDLLGELRLFCSVTAAYSHLPQILDRFRARYPKVDIKLTTGDAADAISKVLGDEADLAIAARPEPLPASAAFASLGEIALALIIPTIPCRVRELATQTQPEWAQIPFILPEHGPARRRIEQWLRAQQITHPHIYATVSGHEAIVSMVALGCGVAAMPTVVVDNSPVRDRIERREISGFAPLELGVCTQKKRLHEPLIAAFWQML